MNMASPHELQYLSLRTAAAVAHIRIHGVAPSGRDTAGIRTGLDDLAHAIAALAPIHVLGADKPAQVPSNALIGARFVRGASALRMQDGTELKGLSIQRRHLEAAIAALRSQR